MSLHVKEYFYICIVLYYHVLATVYCTVKGLNRFIASVSVLFNLWIASAAFKISVAIIPEVDFESN